MFAPKVRVPAFILISSLVFASLAPVLAQVSVEDGESYRIIRTNGKEIVGEVTEYENLYKVKVASGIVVTVRKSQVREILPADAETSGDSVNDPLPERLSDEEIDEILGGEELEIAALAYVDREDLRLPLPPDENSIAEMERYAGKTARRLDTDHFVFIYTSSEAAAKRLAARLETVFEWNVKFAEMFEIPVHRPRHKLEVFYFNTFEEYSAYQTLNGWLSSGALGFYMRTNNRCAFFDMSTWPMVAQALARSKDTSLPHQERLKLRNKCMRWSDWMNLEVIQHEATHAIHFNIGVFPKHGSIGKWMTEGLCVQFEVAPGVAGGSFGAINYSRLNDWHEMYGERGQNVPWQFVKNEILSQGMGYHDYVMGWAINYYLRKTQKEGYAKWMQLIANDDGRMWSNGNAMTMWLERFEEIFGKVDEDWVKEMFEYIGDIPMRESTIVKSPFRGDEP